MTAPQLLVDRRYADHLVAESLFRTKLRLTGTSHDAFRKQYWSNPVAFVHDCFTWQPNQGPTSYQDEILSALVEHRRVAVRGPHGLGKSALGSWVVLWFALTRDGDDWKAPTTASAWRQLQNYFWPEVRKWARRLNWLKIGRAPFDRNEMLTLNLKLSTGEAFALASSEPALIEGAHANHLLYMFDESKTIPGAMFDAAEGAFSNAGLDTDSEAYALSVSTPGEPQGRFYDIHSRRPGYEDWWVKHVTLDECIEARRVSREWADQRKKQWGENSAVYQNRVLGEFAVQEADGIIPLSWVEAANQRWDEWWAPMSFKFPEQLTSIGIDVARSDENSGGDKTVFALRAGKVLCQLKRYSEDDTMSIVGNAVGYLRKHGGKAVVDVIGVGAGVVDRLRELGFEVEAFNAAERSNRLDRSGILGFINRRAAAWWNMRELLDPANGEDIALPNDDLLTGDLTAPHWRVVSGGKIQVESKDDIRKRLGRSTDTGDGVVMSFDEESIALPFGWMRSANGESSEDKSNGQNTTRAESNGKQSETKQIVVDDENFVPVWPKKERDDWE